MQKSFICANYAPVSMLYGLLVISSFVICASVRALLCHKLIFPHYSCDVSLLFDNIVVMSQVTVHWLYSSRTDRILWLLEELKVPYTLKGYKTLGVFSAPEELKKIHPMGKVPIVQVDGFTLAESGAITRYLIEKFGKPGLLQVEAEQDRIDVDYFIEFAEAGVSSLATQLMQSQPFKGDEDGKRITDALDAGYPAPTLRKMLSSIDQRIVKNGTGFLVSNHLTGADTMMMFSLRASTIVVPDLFDKYPNIAKYYKAMASRPAYKAAVAKSKAMRAEVKSRI